MYWSISSQSPQFYLVFLPLVKCSPIYKHRWWSPCAVTFSEVISILRSGGWRWRGHKWVGSLNMYFCFRNLTKSMHRKSSNCFGRLRNCYLKGKWVPRPRTSWLNATNGQEDPSILGTEIFWNESLIYTQPISLYSANTLWLRTFTQVRVLIQNLVLGPKESLAQAF